MVKDAIIFNFKDDVHSSSIRDTLVEFADLMSKRTGNSNILENYTMQVLGKINNREEVFLHN